MGHELENRSVQLAPGDRVWDPSIKELAFDAVLERGLGQGAFVGLGTLRDQTDPGRSERDDRRLLARWSVNGPRQQVARAE